MRRFENPQPCNVERLDINCMILFGIRNLKAGHSTRIQLGKNSKTRTASTGYGICTIESHGCIVMLLLVFTGSPFPKSA